MLQQTQVKTVLPYFGRWLDAFPDFAVLAAASEDRVLKHWEGLGYYSRARNLHRLARELATRTQLPRTAAEWRELPGVGPYTAAAITSIAFGAPEACVDGNVVRILARLTAEPKEFRDSATASKAFAPLAAALLSHERSGDHNQAMMELGATVCLRQNPACASCPVRRFCAAGNSGDPERFPRLAPKLLEERRVTRVWCQRGSTLLLHRAAPGARRFANIHELPLAEHLGLTPAALATATLLAQKRRAITRFKITEAIVSFAAPAVLSEGVVWVALKDLDHITLSGPHRRWIRELLASRRA